MVERDDQASLRGEELVLVVEGQTFTGWERFTVTQSIEAASGTFELEVSHRVPWPIRPGQAVQAFLGEDQILDGFVDELTAASSAARRTIRIAGRDKTADLVDCSAALEPSEFANLRVDQIASQIAAPFGIEVRAGFSSSIGAQAAPYERFAIQPGETAFSAIERAARGRAVLAFTTGDGLLRLENPGTGFADVDLVEGVNVISSTVKVNRRQRFNLYTVKAQRKGSDDGWGEDVAEIEGTATDPDVLRTRPLIILAEGALTFENARDRAQWEATFRAARASTCDVVVQGWRQGGQGTPPWRPNERVRVRLTTQQLDNVLLVRSVRFERSLSGGTRTTLSLTRQDAYTPQPEIPSDEDPFRELLDGQETGTVSGIPDEDL